MAGFLTLRQILEPVAVDAFVSEYLNTKLLYIPGRPGRFSQLFSWDTLNGILNSHLSPTRLRLAKGGQIIPLDTLQAGRDQQLWAPEIAHQLRSGATLIIDSVDYLCDPVASLAEQLERELLSQIRINLYAAFRSTPGFDLHWDDHDVFIFQIAGTKRWRVYGATENNPIGHFSQSRKPEGPPLWDGVLKEGDVLYLPRGWWHAVTPTDEPTLHLTVGLFSATGLDFLQWMTGLLKKYECVRKDVPRLGGAEEQKSYLPAIRQAINEVFDKPNLLRQFLAYSQHAIRPRSAFGFPWMAGSGRLPDDVRQVIHVMAPFGLVSVTKDDDMHVLFNGKDFAFDKSVAPLIAFLRDRSPVVLADFYNEFDRDFDREDLVQFLSDLAQNGIIVMRPPQTV